MLQREKAEKDICGAYELIYPLVSYSEEFKIIEEKKKIEDSKKEENVD